MLYTKKIFELLIYNITGIFRLAQHLRLPRLTNGFILDLVRTILFKKAALDKKLLLGMEEKSQGEKFEENRGATPGLNVEEFD